MARPLRVLDPALPYHVTTRGNDGRQIFHDDRDRLTFVWFLRRAVERFRLRLSAYCLMSTHYHLLFGDGVERLPHAMHRVNGGYAQAFNRRYGREHHVFGRRYASIAIETEQHLLAAHRYIAMNPVAAGACARPQQWRWSSYASTAGYRRAPSFLDVRGALELFGDDSLSAILGYREFVEAAEG